MIDRDRFRKRAHDLQSWHRGHGCESDDGNPRTTAAQAEIDQHVANESSPTSADFLTDAELNFLRTSTTSGNTLLVRAIDELIKRRATEKKVSR